MSSPGIEIPTVEVQEVDDALEEEPVVLVKQSPRQESPDARPVESDILANTAEKDRFEDDKPPSPPAREPLPSTPLYEREDRGASSSHSKQTSYSAKQYKSPAQPHSSSRSGSRLLGPSYAAHRPPREYASTLDIGAALSREFRGTSPSVLEKIASHPLLQSGGFEPLRHPSLSARSRKVLRQAGDLVYTAPGLKNLLEVCASGMVGYF
ncbi:hypothetical protein EGW08_010370 [Elysia chlorotica]|uniref:Uncharacterized protein n=1 Tax=Elysia chlorotica TaxID=188477 RepID=A0A433TJS6_ELYCH|nr:hypothetical protein EGW08_010370 [Elysia chlorotica]